MVKRGRKTHKRYTDKMARDAFEQVATVADLESEFPETDPYERRPGESAQGHALRVAMLPKKLDVDDQIVNDADSVWSDGEVAELEAEDEHFRQWLDLVAGLRSRLKPRRE